MALTQLVWEQNLKASMDDIWTFISSPENLSTITPAYMKFRITSKHKKNHMYAGMLISYKVTPVLNIPLNWVTEITHVKENSYFIDNQKSGPYKIWHHEHHIQAIDGGVKMIDKLSYQLPFGLLGSLVERLFVRKKIMDIFQFRNEKLNEIYGTLDNK